MFGEGSAVNLPEPEIPFSEAWSSVYRLNKEKEVLGVYLSGHPLDDFRIEIESFCRGEVRSLNEMENNKGKDLMIAAVVTEGEHRITRKGDGFGTLTIEDYNDSFKLNIFNEKYLKFKHFMDPGTFVIIKGRIEDHKWGKGLEFNVHGMQLLQGLRESKAKSLDLKLSFKSVNDGLISELQEVLMKTENKGKCRVNFMIYDNLDKIHVNLSSRSVLINPTDELFKKLNSMNIDYKLN
jgi:DNA polymerase-3 subunit alpha